MIAIGPYQLSSPVVLAPMAGVTDRPFRQLCRRYGAGLAVGEMLTSDHRLWDSPKSRQRRNHQGETGPIAVQIAGSDPQQMAEAARLNADAGAQIIDINMGCPAKKGCKRAAGSALLRDESLVAAILEAVVAAVPEIPVTLKIRTGWSPEERNGVRIARIAEAAGIRSLAVHGRTRACRFEGAVEYDTIAAIKQAVAIPVLANGDIDSPQKAAAVLAHTGADGVMIGRAAQGRPWLCSQIATYLRDGELLPDPAHAEWAAVVLAHLDALHDFYGEPTGVRIARKHIAWYLERRLPAGSGATFLPQFKRLESAAAQREALQLYLQAEPTNEELAA